MPVLLIFSGSDWCLPCKRIEKNILADTSFRKFAQHHLITFIADFPQKKKLPDSEKISNEKLADEFNPKGIFPLLLLVKPNRTIVASLEYENYSAGDFVKQVNKILVSENMLQEQTANAKLMGSAFEFIVGAADKQTGNALLQDCIEEVKRLEKILTEFSDDSDTSLINQHAGISPVEVSPETYQLLQRCKHISTLTDGAFDITSGILKKLYNFKQQDFVLPSPSRIAGALNKTGYKKIKLLPGNRVFLEEKDMHIGFGAIGKGYAADMVKKMMQKKAVATGVINASGDLIAWGLRNDGEYWKAGIADPDDPSRILLWFPLNEQAIATSGNAEQYFEINGARYSHNIDPKSGYPVKGIKSVSVISPSAELSDALATGVTVMGIAAGMHFINQLPQTWCIVVDDQNKLHYSKKINVDATV
jgi:thiamine biosynthesis lipoprotein